MASDAEPGLDAQAHSIRAEMAAEMFPAARMIFTVAVLVGMPATMFIELRADRGGVTLWAQVAIFGVALALLWLPGLPVRLRNGVMIAAALAVDCLALVRYGPMAGNALILLAATYAGGIFFGRRGTLVVATLSAVIFVGSGAAVTSLHAFAVPPAAFDPRAASTWVRTGLTVAVVVAALVHLLDRLVVGLERLSERIARSRVALAQAEDARERALAALVAAQRLQALGHLVAGTAHDFRNSLTAVLGGLEALQLQTSREGMATVAGDVERAARAAAATANQLVTFGRSTQSQGATCRPDVVVAVVARTLSRVLPKSVAVQAEVAEAPDVGMDEATLSQAILNLALNARDAMPRGGTLGIRIAVMDGRVLIEVADTGCGMDDATRASAMKPFFTTKPVGQGSGLGLAMVRDAVVRAGGEVLIDSSPGTGTTVRLELPALQPAAVAQGAQA